MISGNPPTSSTLTDSLGTTERRLKIWFTEIGEPLPLEADVRLHRYGNLTQSLSRAGHDVTWWTSNFTHAAKRFVVDSDHVGEFNGVTLRILKGPGYRKNISPARFRHQAHFARRFYDAAQQMTPPDILISPIPTLEAAELAVRYGKEKGIPVLTDIRDEWPEDFVRLAPKFARCAARLALHFYFKKVKYICKNATGILGISQRQLNYGLNFSKRQQGPNDGIFPLGYNTRQIDPAKVHEASGWWRQHGVTGDKFTLVFFGTIGPFFNLGTVIEAARKLSAEIPLQFVFCGHGSRLDRYRTEAKDLPNIIFPGWVNEPQIASLMKMAKVGLAPYASDAQSMSLPNKPFEYFAGSLPVISSIKGELSKYIADHDCGRTYEADSVESLCTAIRELYHKPDVREQMGSRANRLLNEQFTTEIIFDHLNRHLINVVERFKNQKPSVSVRKVPFPVQVDA